MTQSTPQSTPTILCLDHGWVKLRNLSGPTRRIGVPYGTQLNAVLFTREFDADDTDPANSARMSFDSMDKGRSRDDDLKLCRYLMANKHTTPFEMVECWIEMKMPIFVARQFVRHRTVTINEVSARYVPLPAEWYIPQPENVGLAPKKKKQGRDDTDALSEDEKAVHKSNVLLFLDSLQHACSNNYMSYQWAIEHRIPLELARSFLHLNHYTHWLWKQDLHNVMHFLSLRDHSHAQFEAQVYAKAVAALLEQYLPNSMALYREFRRMPE